MAEKYGKLTVVCVYVLIDSTGKKKKRAKCLCDCGGEHETCYYNLRRGNVNGCKQCSSAVRGKSTDFKHMQSAEFKASNSEEYKVFCVWKSMVSRCHNVKNKSYPRYGGRGIFVCDEWRGSFDIFLSHMGKRPTPQHQIDRTDNNKGYEKGNCKWVTSEINARNKRNNRHLEINGEVKCVSEWAEISGVKVGTALMRLNRGWSAERAIFGNGQKKRYNTPEGGFSTLKEVQERYGMSSSGAHNRFVSKNYPDWIIKEVK